MTEVANRAVQQQFDFESLLSSIKNPSLSKLKSVEANSSTVPQTLVYEQPVNELVRTCLRLEYLFKQIDSHLDASNVDSAQTCLLAIIQVMQLLDRGDIKAKLIQEFKRQAGVLKQMAVNPQINEKALNSTIDEINHAVNLLYAVPGKLGQELRANDFINAVRTHANIPAGFCSFDVPHYHYWLQACPRTRRVQLAQWASCYAEVKKATSLMLKIVRDCGVTKLVKAHSGFYQQSFSGNAHVQLIQVCLPLKQSTLPEISAGRQRCTVRFIEPNFEGKNKTLKQDLTFQLTCCAL